MLRCVCLLLMVVALAAGCFLALGSFDHAYANPSSVAPESVVAKCEPQAGPVADRLMHRGEKHDDCPGGVCHRHDESVQIEVEMKQPPEAAAKSDPIWPAFAIGGGLLVILIGSWYVSALDG